MKKFIAAIILVTMSLGMAQAEGNNNAILVKVMARNAANSGALEQLQKEAAEKVGDKKTVTVMDLNGNPIEISVTTEPETEPEPQHKSWFQNAIDWVTFWD